jgi:tRNA-dihydrouridine synthase A
LSLLLRPLHGLYAGYPGARAWRRFLTEEAGQPGAGADLLERSLRIFRDAA